MVDYDELCLIFKIPKKTLIISRYNAKEFDYFNNLVNNINNFKKDIKIQNIKGVKRICVFFNESFDFDINIFISRFKSTMIKGCNYLYILFHLVKAYDYFCLKTDSILNIEINETIENYYTNKFNGNLFYKKNFIYDILKLTNHNYLKLLIFSKVQNDYLMNWDYIINLHIEEFKKMKPLENNLEQFIKENNDINELVNNIKVNYKLD